MQKDAAHVDELSISRLAGNPNSNFEKVFNYLKEEGSPSELLVLALISKAQTSLKVVRRTRSFRSPRKVENGRRQ